MLRRTASSRILFPVSCSLLAMVGLGLVWAVPMFAGAKDEIRTLQGHTGPVACVAYSPDGSVIATGGFDKVLKLWDAASGRELRSYTGHTNLVLAVGFSRNGRKLVSGSLDNTVKLWDVPMERPARTLLATGSAVRALALSPDGKLLVSGGTGSAQLWDANPSPVPPPAPAAGGAKPPNPNDPIRALAAGPADAVTTASFLPNGQQIVGGDPEGRLLLWNLADGKLLDSLMAHTGPVTAIVPATSGSQVFSAGEDGLVKLWALPFAPRREIAGHTGPIRALAMNPANNQTATIDSEGVVRTWNFPAGTPVRTIETKAGDLTCLAYNPAGSVIAVGCANRSIEFWDLNSGQSAGSIEGLAEPPHSVTFVPNGQGIISAGDDGAITLWTLPLVPMKPLAGHTEPAQTLVLSPDAKTLASGGADGIVRLWDAAAGTVRATLTPPAVPGAPPKPAAVVSLSFSGDGRRLATASADKIARVWDVAANKLVRAIPTEAEVRSVALDREGRRLLIGTANAAIPWIEVPDEAEVRPALAGHTDAITVMALSPDGATLITGGNDRSLRFWTLADGKQTRTLTNLPAVITSLAFLPDGQTITWGGSDGAVRFTRLQDGMLTLTLAGGHKAAVTSLSVSPDGKTLASGGADTIIGLWELTGANATTKPRTLVGASGPVVNLSFTADGHQLVSGSDQAIRTWDVRAGTASKTLAHGAAIRAISINAAGTTIASTGDDRTIKLWDPSTGQVRRTIANLPAVPSSLIFSPDGSSVIVGFANGTVGVWDATNGSEAMTYGLPAGAPAGPVSAVRVAADHQTLLAAGADRLVRFRKLPLTVPLQTLKGHTKGITSVLLFGDGKQAASASEDGTVRMWDLSTGAELRALRGHAGAVLALAASPDGKSLISGGADRTARLWDATDGKERSKLTDHAGPVQGVAFSLDGTKLATIDAAGTARVWTSAGRPIERFSHPGAPQAVGQAAPGHHSAVVFTSDNLGLFSGGIDPIIRRWTMTPAKLIGRHDGPATRVVALADGRTVSAGEDMSVRVWTPDGKEALRMPHPAPILAMALGKNGTLLATGGDDEAVHLWDLAKGVQIQTYPGHLGPIQDLAFSPDGSRLASAGRDHTMRVWSTPVAANPPAPGALLQTFDHPEQVTGVGFGLDNKTLITSGTDTRVRLMETGVVKVFAGHTGPVTGLALAAGGNQLVTSGEDKTVRHWDVNSGTTIRVLALDAAAKGLAISADGGRLLTGTSDGRLQLWSLGDGKLVQTYEGHHGPVRAVVMSKAADLLASASDDGTVRAWSAPLPDPAMAGKMVDGKLLQTFHPANPATVLTMLPDSRTILSGGSGRTIESWEPASDREVRTFTGHAAAVQAVAFSPDSTMIASGSADTTVKLWDPKTGGQIRSLDGHKAPVYAVAFNPDGTTVVSASGDKTILLRDPKTGAVQRTLLGSDDAIYALAYRLDGMGLASGGLDRAIRFWDPTTGTITRTVPGLPDDIYGLAFSPGGGRLISTGYAGNVFIWNAETGKQIFKHRLPFSASSVCYAPDGRHVAVACSDSQCYIFNLPEAAQD